MQSTKSSASTFSDPRSVAGRAPMLTQGTPISSRFAHTSGGGFCMVCGTVWPGSQAARLDNGAPPTHH